MVSSVADIAIASTLAIGGIAMTPLPALLVAATLAAAAVFAFALDFVKVPVFVWLGIAEGPGDRPLPNETRGTAEPVPSETKPSEPKPSEPKPGAEAEAKAPSVTPQMIKRVHELYEELGREDVQAVQDWEKAEREHRKG
jgi:hypothetical protein